MMLPGKERCYNCHGKGKFISGGYVVRICTVCKGECLLNKKSPYARIQNNYQPLEVIVSQDGPQGVGGDSDGDSDSDENQTTLSTKKRPGRPKKKKD